MPATPTPADCLEAMLQLSEKLEGEELQQALARVAEASRDPVSMQKLMGGGLTVPSGTVEDESDRSLEEGPTPDEDDQGVLTPQDPEPTTYAKTEEDEEIPEELIDVPDVPQETTHDCGAASSMAVGKYFGVGPDDLSEWRKALGTSEEYSTRPDAIVEYLSSLGLEAEARDGMTLDDLSECWQAGKPVIVFISEYGPGLENKKAKVNYGHIVVVIGRGLGMVFIQDPSESNILQDEDSDDAPGRTMIEEATFLEKWKDTALIGPKGVRYGIVVGRPGEAVEEPVEQEAAEQETTLPEPEALDRPEVKETLKTLLVQLGMGPEDLEPAIAEVKAVLGGSTGKSHTVDAAAAEAHPTPSDAQKEANNYKLGHVRVQGLDISIENAKGSERSGVGEGGKPWKSTLAAHYGYIKGTVGKDKPDQVDVFLGPNPESEIVFVIDQLKANGNFDEHKACLFFTNREEAEQAYLGSYEEGWDRIGNITTMTMPQFKTWLTTDTHRPAAKATPTHYSKEVAASPYKRQLLALADRAERDGDKASARIYRDQASGLN